jgi:hypothetical protein
MKSVNKQLEITSRNKKRERSETYKRNNQLSKCKYLFLFFFRQGRLDMKRSPPQDKVVVKKI